MSQLTTINDEWKRFESACLANDAPSIQRTEMKKAFFAGAAQMLVMTLAASDLSDDDAKTRLKSLKKQCRGFGEAVKMGAV